MHLRRRGQVYVVDFLDADGKRRRVSTGATDRTDAAKRARVIVGDSQRSGRVTVRLHDALERVWRERWQQSKSAITLQYVVPAIQRDLGSLPIARVDYAAMSDYGERLRGEGKSAATINRRLSAISAALTECARRGELATLPPIPHYHENNTRDRYLTPAEEQRALEYMRRMQADDCAERRPEWVYLEALAVFLLDSGCRLSEALGLRDVIGLPSPAIHLRHGSTKSDKGRTVPLTSRAYVAARTMLAHPLHGVVGVDWCGHRWGKVRKACELGDVNLHVLRHTCASRLVQRGVDLYTVSRWLGHSSVKVTERYAHLSPGALSHALAALEGRPVRVSRDGTLGTPVDASEPDSTDLGTLKPAKRLIRKQ